MHGEVIENGEVIRRLVTETQTIQIIESNIVDNTPIGELNPSVAEQIDAKASEAVNAKITAATVTVDDNTGTPYAEVFITGENRTKSLDFVFHNLKGEKGDTGDKGDPGDQGETGETGQTGEQGPVGPTPSFSIGDVESGDTAAATITGSDEYPVLNFVLPKGDTGEAGADGADGVTPTLAIGTVSSGASASATLTGTPPDYVLNLVIPKGDTGSQGPTGPDGADGVTPELSIGTVTTGEPGTDADVTIGGTAEAPIMDFVIPRGEVGEAGIFWATPANIRGIEDALAAGQFPVAKYNFTQSGINFKGVATYSYKVEGSSQNDYYFFDSQGRYRIEICYGFSSLSTNALIVAIEDYTSTPAEGQDWKALSSAGAYNLLANIIANPYSPSQPYVVGDYVYKDALLYRCTTAITIPEVWNASHWTVVKLANELKRLFDSVS